MQWIVAVAVIAAMKSKKNASRLNPMSRLMILMIYTAKTEVFKNAQAKQNYFQFLPK